MIFFILFFAALILTVLVVPISIRIANGIGAIDRPGYLKIHNTPVPRFGGMAIFVVSFVLSLIIIYFSAGIEGFDGTIFKATALAAIFIFGIGSINDVKEVSPKIRLASQILASLILIFAGVRIASLPLILGIPLTIFIILGACNALNLIDGMDGLATGVTIIISAGFLVVSIFTQNLPLTILSLIIMGSATGFLLYNFNPAEVFLGDSGSTLLGFLLGVSAIIFCRHSPNLWSITIPIVFLGFPIADTGLAILRRSRNGGQIFIGDRDHIYDKLLKKGYSVRKSVVICYLMNCILVGIGLILFFITKETMFL